MTAVAVKGSSGEPMVFTQSEATAAQATWVFHLVKSADGTDDTAVVPVVTISKAGGAFASAGGAVTEISGGWYKIVFTATDLNTIGALAVNVAVATADTLNVVHQVTLFDQNVAGVTVASGGIASTAFASGAITAAAIATDAIGAAELAADAVTEIQAGLALAADVSAVLKPTTTRTIALGTISADGASKGFDCTDAVAVTLTATGTFGSGTMTVETCADPRATSPVWVATALTCTSNASKVVTLPVRAVRWSMSGSTSPTVVCTATVGY
jgi:hypothetical protein